MKIKFVSSLTLNWLGRLFFWNLILTRNARDMSVDAAGQYIPILAVSATCLVAIPVSLLNWFLGRDEMQTVVLISVVSLLAYLLIGTFCYFANPNTNGDIPWQVNGPW